MKRPLRTTSLAACLLLFSFALQGKTQKENEPLREPKIELEIKRYAVPSLIQLLKKADAENRVIPFESFMLTEPHRLLEAESIRRPTGHVHPALLDERYYAVSESTNLDHLKYLKDIENGLYYVIRDGENDRPAFAIEYAVWGESEVFHFDYDDRGILREVRTYAVRIPDQDWEGQFPELREEFNYSELNESNISYRRFSYAGWTRGNIGFPFETEFRSQDGGKTMDLTVFPVLESGRRTESPCIFYRTVDGEKVSGKLSGDSFCGHFHGPYFHSTLVGGVDFPLEASLAEGDYLFRDFEEFLVYRFPEVRLEELTVEFTSFQDDEVTGARFLKGNRLLLEFKFLGYKGNGRGRSFSWQMRFADAFLLAEDEEYISNIDWPDYRSKVTLVYHGKKIQRRLTADGRLDIRSEGLLRRPYFNNLHPLLKMYLIELLKAQESPPQQRRMYSATAAQAADLQRIIDSAQPGDTILLHAGTYRLDKPLKMIDKSYLTLQADHGVQLLIGDPNAPVIKMVRGNHVRLQGFHAKHEAASGCSTPVISIGLSRNVVLRHLELDGSGTHAVLVYFSRDILIEHNYLHGNSLAAIGFDIAATHGLKNVVIRFNRIENNPMMFEAPFLPGNGEIEFYGNTGQALTRQRCEMVEEKNGDRFIKCGEYQ